MITYSFTITNTGTVTLDPVTVTDPLPGLSAISSPATLLAGGADMTCTATYVITQADIDAGQVDNEADVSGTRWPTGPDVTDDDPHSEPTVRNPDIDIDKTPASQIVRPGETATFTIEVTNTGNVTLTDVTVDDPLAPDCDADLGTLAPDASTAYTCEVANVTEGFTNVAEASGTPPAGQDVTDSEDADVSVAAIRIIKSVRSDLPLVNGAVVEFRITVKNIGEVDLRRTAVADPLFFACVRSAAQVRAEKNQQGNNVGFILKPGEQFSYTCTDEVGSSFTNVATATATAPGVPVEDSDDADVPVVSPDIRIWKTPGTQEVPNSGVVEFTIRVKNIGDVNLRRTVVTDDLFASCARSATQVRSEANQQGDNVGFVLKVGEEFTYTCSDEISDPFTNQARAVAFWKTTQVTDFDEAEVTAG